MGSCAGKKSVQVDTSRPVIVGKSTQSFSKSPEQEMIELRKMYEEEGQYMNRKVKACFEVAFAGEAPHTAEINMKFINLGETGALHLVKVLPAFTGLKSLRLWKTKLGIEGAKLLGAVLPRLAQLEVLSLEDNEIKAEGANYIARALPSVPLVKELYLHVNKMGQEGVTALSAAFAIKANLRILTMDENQIAKPGLQILLTSLTKTMPIITLLGLAFNQLGDDGAMELINALNKMPELKKLTLSGNNLSSNAEKQLKLAAPSIDFLF